MIRGLYTAAAGMMTQQHTMDSISNNLANINTTSYKEDISVHKAFPELLLRRLHTNISTLPISKKHPHLGSLDKAPIIGKLGTGVEQNEIFTVFSQGSMQETANSFDIALEGKGFFVIDTPFGQRMTRNGSFHISPESILVNKEGYPVMGENGIIRIESNNFVIDQNGNLLQAEELAPADTLLITTVNEPRYLKKQGASLYKETWESGPMEIITTNRPKVRQGFIETSNVNAVVQMVKMIAVNRAYEANQQIIKSQDEASDKLINRAMRF